MRLGATLALLLTTVFAGTADAAHHHKAWWEFFQGTWNVDATTDGTVTFAMSPTGEALTAQWKYEDGGSAFEVAGWQPDKNIMLVTGYGANSVYWHIQFEKISSDTMEGSHHGQLQDGKAYKGRIVVKKIDNDTWTWEIKGKTAEGEDVLRKGHVTRK